MFLKHNSFDNDSLIKEAKGLILLKESIAKTEACTIKIPQIYSVKKDKLKLQKIESFKPSKALLEEFGLSLAMLHMLKFPFYGLEYDNYIGLSVQKNRKTINWGEFFYTNRLLFQVEMIKDEQIKEEFLTKLKSSKEQLIKYLNSNVKHSSILPWRPMEWKCVV